jgi:hypothetical protein
MNLLPQIERLNRIISANLKFMDAIRDKDVRGLVWRAQVAPFWRLREAFLQKLEN